MAIPFLSKKPIDLTLKGSDSGVKDTSASRNCGFYEGCVTIPSLSEKAADLKCKAGDHVAKKNIFLGEFRLLCNFCDYNICSLLDKPVNLILNIDKIKNVIEKKKFL